jgi:hypothetical protein
MSSHFLDPMTDALRSDDSASPAQDSDATLGLGRQAIAAMGNDLARAASGDNRDVDMDSARLRLRDVQTALVSLGFTLADEHNAVEHIEQGDSRALTECVRQFQDENDLEMTGIIDRETYGAIMGAFEGALGVQAHDTPQDDFSFMHADAALNDGSGVRDALADDSYQPKTLDAGEQALLNLPGDLDAGLEPQELEDL